MTETRSYQEIPREAIDQLLEDPSRSLGFDEVFGQGRAAEVLAANNSLEGAESAPQERPSIITETIRAVAGGALDAIEESGEFIQEQGEALGQRMNDGRDIFYSRETGFEWITHEEAEGRDDIPRWQTRNLLGDGGTIDIPDVTDNETMAGQFGRGAVQFLTGFAAAGKATRLKGFWGAMANGAIADAIVWDPKDPNLTATLEELGFDMGTLGDVLATDPDDPNWQNRFRNAAEGAGLGVVVDAIAWGVRARKAKARGDDKAAAEYEAKEQEALSTLNDALEEASEVVAKDRGVTLDLKKATFDKIEADAPLGGQMRVDLGEAPAVRPSAAPERPIYVTPETAEKIRLQASLARTAPTAEKQRLTSFRSLDTFTSLGHAADAIAGEAAVLSDEFSKVKGGNVQRWETVKEEATQAVREMAQMMGEDPDALIDRFMTGGVDDPAKLAGEIHARRNMARQVNEDLMRMADAIRKGVFNPADFPTIRDIDHLRVAFQQRMELAANLTAGLDAMRSNVGRALNAMKMATEDDKFLQSMLKDPALVRDVDTAVQAITDPANRGKPPISVARQAMDKARGYMEQINRYRINALLSGPGTQEVNAVSNALNMLLIPAEQAVGGAVSLNRKQVSHAMRTFKGMFLGMREAGSTAMQAGWYDEAILDPFNAKIDDPALTSKPETALGKVVNLPSRALMTMDEFFKQAQYRGRVFADAHEEALEQGLSGDDLTAYIQDYLKGSYSESGAATRADALLQAQRSTFTEGLDDKFSLAIQRLALEYPAVRFILPFVRTPLNILSQTWQHIPVLGATSGRFRADLAAGGARRAQAIGKWAVGASLMTLAGTMVAQGRITGSGPKDPRIRNVWLKNNQPYAFRIDNEDGTVFWVSYARMEPLSNIFSIAADMAEIQNDPYAEYGSSGGIAAGLLMAFMENTVNKTFTQGIHDFMTVMTGDAPHKSEKVLHSAITSFIPNAINQMNGDDLLRESRTLADMAMARTHLYNGVDPRRNVLGEPVVRRLPKYDPLGLSNSDTREVDKVMAEITRVAILNQSVAGNPNRRIPGPNEIDLSEIPHSDTQSLYDRWVELTGEVEIGGKTLREKLEEMILSRSYQRLPDGFEGASGNTKARAIRKIISSYREKAKSELPELREIIKAERKTTAALLKDQYRSNIQAERAGGPRELFPASERPQGASRPRTFEDLLDRRSD